MPLSKISSCGFVPRRRFIDSQWWGTRLDWTLRAALGRCGAYPAKMGPWHPPRSASPPDVWPNTDTSRDRSVVDDNYVPHMRVSLKSHPQLNEKWLQSRIADDTSILGLGDLDVKDLERRQPHAGRLDMLLSDADTNTRYEVEIQLGATDESHIVRTIEYWDLERKRYPQYDHVAVIVAESITARFFNVISLFNGFIPIIAVQVQAIEMNGAITLVCTTVLDRMVLGDEEDDVPDEPRDRAYWELKASPRTLALTDELLGIITEVEPAVSLKYNKNYIGLARNGLAANFVQFRPRNQHVVVEFKIPRSDELTQRLEDAGIEVLVYSTRWGRYRMQVTEGDVAQSRDLLRELVVQARDNYGS